MNAHSFANSTHGEGFRLATTQSTLTTYTSLHEAPMYLSHCRPFCLVLSLLLILPALQAQVVSTSVNDEGVSAPCIGIGLGILLEKKCVEATARAGFLHPSEIGHSGITLAPAGPQDGVILTVDPGSPSAAAGLKPGDLLLAIDGHPAQPTPAAAVTQQLFGPRDEVVHLKVRHAGADRDVELKRAPANAPSPPRVSGMFIANRPLIDWREKYIPCMSAIGPTGLPGLMLCEKHFRKDGYIRASDLGTTGLTLRLDPDPAGPTNPGPDPTSKAAALIAAVAPNSPAAAANLQPGDQILSVDNQPPSTSTSVNANILLFGKVGDKRTVLVKQGDTQKTVDLTLIAR